MKARALLIGVAALGLAGCGVGTTAPEPINVPDRMISDPGDAERAKRLLVSQDPVFRGVSADTIGEVSYLVCGRLDAGYSATEIGDLAMDSGFTMRQAAAVIAVSIVVFCPWNEDRVR